MANNKKRQAALGRKAFVRFSAALVVACCGLWATGLTPLDAFGPAPDTKVGASPQLKTISAKAGRRITTITIETSDPVAYLTNRPDPLTLLVDLREVDTGRAARAILETKGIMAGASVEAATAADGARVARVRIKLLQPAAHQVRSKRNLIHVDFDSAFPLGSAGATPVLTGAGSGSSARFATTLDAVRAEAEATGATVTLTGNGELVAESVTPLGDGTPRVVLDFPNVRSKTPADVFVGRGPVSVVQVTTTGVVPTTRVVVNLLRPASYRVVPPEEGQKEFKIIFDDTDSLDAPLAASKQTFVASLDPIEALLASPRPGVAGRVPMAQQQPGAVVPPLPPQAPQAPSQTGGQRKFTGHPVTFDFQGADLRTVLRTFADISGLNIVIDQNVQGTVDVVLNEVPWDQALDIILRDHRLGYSVEGTIVRIAPLSVLAQEEEERRKLADAQRESGELEVLTRTLSYAKAADLVPLLTRTALSNRGDIQIDPRTNTIIIRDLAARLQGAAELMATLDRPQPQVEIEARIVTTTRDFARNLGVQWGFNGRVAADLGNTTGLAFPNQGTLTGRTGGVQGPIQGDLIDHASTAINLGVSPATSAIGLALGSVNGALNLEDRKSVV